MGIRLARRPRRIGNCENIADLRVLAARRLPSPMFHYLDGGADDEWTMRRNVAAFRGVALLPQLLRDVSTVDMTTRLLGQPIAMPLILSPTGANRLFHHEGEAAVARAAARAGTFYSLSTVGTASIEDIAAIGDMPKMFQIYLFRDRGLTAEFVERCRAANYAAMCLTIDTAVAGNRERDRVTGMTMPPRLGLASLASFAMHPRWTINHLRAGPMGFHNVEHRVDAGDRTTGKLAEYVSSQFDRTADWAHAEWLIGEWGGPFVIKGIQSVIDAKRAVAAGASALMISNHGGRQVDGALAPIELLPRIRDAIGGAAELIVDGGIRRGAHVVKALAMGANACSIGRPYLYGLAAGGEAGVTRALTLLSEEIERTMALMGCASVDQITPDLAEWIRSPASSRAEPA